MTLNKLGANIAGHDYDAITKINPSPLGIGQMTIIEDLEKDIKYIIMRLFNFVEKDSTIGLPSYGLS